MKRTGENTNSKIRRNVSLTLAAAVIVCLAVACAWGASAAPAHLSKHAQAKILYAKAQQLQETLDAQPQKKRTLKEYKRVVAAYRRVYLLTPSAPETSEALYAVAQLYHDMGDQFDAAYYQNSLVTYQFLLAQYPANRHRSDSLFAIGQLEKDNLNERPEAKDAFNEYLRRFPHAEHADEAREALAELAHPPQSAQAANQPSRDVTTPASQDETATQQPPAAATNADLSAGETEIGNDAGAGIAKPGEASSVTSIRTWNADDYTRVVVDLNGGVKWEASRIKHPDRIYFDLYKARLAPSLTDKELPVMNGFLKSVRVAQNKTGVVRLVLDVQSVEGYSAFLLPNPYRLVIDVHGADASASTSKPAVVLGPGRLAGDRPPAGKNLEAQNGADTGRSAGRTSATVAPQPSPIAPVAAKPTRDGERSLTRALGLKISRIVIDPGHGGYDTGTIGPDGVMEKTVCLDVALRLGKLIQRYLPGVQVIYTRKTDVFVPLEERTAIANQAKADLFISIHANSSQDHAARGVETYYLNFTTSPEALEVASRENALSDASIHQLQNLIQKIARNDKVEESRELATDIQDSLTHQLRLVSTAERNRGVKQAPFVVLIGANMPSVLTEISFLSNPIDEHLMERPAQREKIAQGIFRGIETYLSSLNSLNMDRQRLVTDRQTASATDRNQR